MPSTELAPPPAPDAPPTEDAPTAPARAVDGRRNDTRERLVRSSVRLFARKGYAGTSVAEIEGAVGLRAGSGGLYRHFPSKEALLLAAVGDYHRRVRQLRRRLAEESEAEGGPTVAADLRRLVGELANFLSGEQPMLQVTLDAGSLPEEVRRAVGAAWDDGYGMAADVFARHGVGEERARVLAVAAIGSLNHYVAHLGTWGEEPFGVPLMRYLDAWAELWEGAVGGASG